MTMTTTPSRVEGEHLVAIRAPTLGWALRRALLGLLILFISVTGAAWLLYASIDPVEEVFPAATLPGQAGVSRPIEVRPIPVSAPHRL
jgi:hypothetical protein